MSKKDLMDETLKGAGVMNTIATGHADTPKPKRTKKEYYTFSLNMPPEYRDYLNYAAYYSGGPGNVVTITKYICNLIAEDMKKHKDWRPNNGDN